MVPALRELSKVNRLPDNWWQTPHERLKEEALFFDNATARASDFQVKENEYHLLFSVGWCEAARLLGPAEDSFGKWYRRSTPSYWRWRSGIQSRLKPSAKSDFSSLVHYHGLARELCDLDAWFDQNRERLCASVDYEHLRDKEVLARVALEYRAAALLREALAAIGIAPEEGYSVSADVHRAVKSLLAKFPPQSSELTDCATKIDRLWPKGFVNGRRSPRKIDNREETHRTTPEETAEPRGRQHELRTGVSVAAIDAVVVRAQELLTNIRLLQEWLQLMRILRKCVDHGLSEFIEALTDISAKRARLVFQRCVYKA
jgi:hypothetical protein